MLQRYVRQLGFTLLVSTLAAAGCKMRPPAASADVKIFGGSALPEEHPGLLSAVGLARNGRPVCTAVLVADRLLLTAAHCLIEAAPADGEEGAAPTPLAPSALVAYVGPQFAGSTRAAVAALGVHEAYRPGKPAADIGWIKLTDALPGLTPVTILAEGALRDRQVLAHVGYGVNDQASGPSTGVRLAVNTFFDAGRGCPSLKGLAATGLLPDAMTAPGDSGGPTYARFDERWYLATLNHGRENCDEGARTPTPLQTVVAAYLDWLQTSAGVSLAAQTPDAAAKVTLQTVDRAFLAACEDAKAPEAEREAFAAVVAAKLMDSCAALANGPELVRVLELARPSLLKPLAYLKGLERLTINNASVTDWSALADLKNLRSLSITGSEVGDLRPLAALTMLKNLTLNGTAVRDLSPLGGLKALRTADLADNQIVDLKPLADLTSLCSLGLERNPELADVSPLKDLASLKALRLSGDDKITNVKALTSPTLVYIDVRNARRVSVNCD